MTVIPDIALGAIAAAVIGGTISLLGLIISKEQKTSEFRQIWIDALRSDVSSFLTQINAIRDAVQVDYETHEEKVESLRPLYIALNTSTFNIMLRVNPSEDLSKNLLAAMEKFSVLTLSEHDLVSTNMRLVEAELLNASKILLKSEWKRVKSGEITFRIAKFLALAVVVLAMVGTGFILYNTESNKSGQITPSSISTFEFSAPAPAAQETKSE